MRMQKCPHCGADNSVRRSACYQCQRPFPAPAEDSAAYPAAASRWDTIEPLAAKPTKRVLRPAPDAFPAPAPEGTAQPRPRPQTYMPAFRRPRRHVRQMGIFFRQLRTLTNSGIPLAAALREVSQRAPGRLRPLAAEMGRSAEAGDPIHEVMERHRDLFYAWHIGLVGAAQAGGYLPEAFDQIAHAYEVEWETRSALVARVFFYTVFVLPLALIVVPLILMLREPIPEAGWTPQQLLQVALGYVRTVSLRILVGLVALYLVGQAVTATAWFQGMWQRVVIHLPILGPVARAAALDRYLATLGLLLRGGIPVSEAAEQAAQAAGNAALSPRLLNAAAAMRDGVPLSQALAEVRVLDRDTINMAATGETSGSLPDMLVRAAGYHRGEHEMKRRRAVVLSGVALGVFWAAVVGAITIWGALSYFDYMFRGLDWMMQ